MAAGFPAGCGLAAKFRAFAENQRGGFKQGCAVSEPQAAGKKPLPVPEAERDKQPVKRAYLCHKPCVSKIARFLAGLPAAIAESIPIRNRRTLAKDPILLSLRRKIPPVSRLGT